MRRGRGPARVHSSQQRPHGGNRLRRRQRHRASEAGRQDVHFHSRHDRLIVQETLLNGGPVPLLKLRLAVAVIRLRASQRELVQPAGIADHAGLLQPSERRIQIGIGFDIVRVHGRLIRDDVAIVGFQRGARCQERHELALAAKPLVDHIRSFERGQDVLLILQGIRETEDTALQDDLRLRIRGGVLPQQRELFLELCDLIRDALADVVAGRQALTVAIRVAGEPRHEREVTVLDAVE